MMRRILHLSQLVLLLCSLVAPAASAAEPQADPEAWRAVAPTPLPAKSVATPVPQVFRLGAMEVLLIERHDLPTISLQLLLAGGSAWDPPGREGQASLCMELLEAGAAKLNLDEISDKKADLAVAIDAWTGVEQQGLNMAVLSRNFLPSLDLFADLLLHPSLGPRHLANAVARRKAALLQTQANPALVARRVAGPVAYGAQAWGRLATEASLSALDVAGCTQHDAALSPEGAHLYVVGDVTRPALEKAWLARFGEWKTPAPKLAPLGKPLPPAGRVFAVDLPGAEQTLLHIMAPGPERTATDYEATTLMMGVLATGFTSRINMNLREKHGWTYGAGGSFQYRRDGSLLSLTAAVRVDASGPSVSEMISEINTIRASPVTLDELAREKEGDILELPARWSTGKSIANTLQTLQYYGLPLNWYDGYAARVQAVDLAALQKAARDHLDVDAAVVLIVGDFKKITPQIEALISSGPLAGQVVHRLDTDGKPLPALAK